MRTALRYARHTLIGPWLVLPMLVLEVVTFLQRGTPWLGEGMWTVDWFAVVLFLLGPVCSGVAAVDAARLSRPGNIHLVLSVPRPQRVYLRAALWCAGPLAAVHTLTVVVALIAGQVDRPSASWWSIVGGLAVQLLAIFWYTALGSAIGRFTSPLLAGLLGGVSSFVLNYVLSNAFDSGPQFRLLKFGGATITLMGRDYNPGYLAGQAALLILTAALFIGVGLRSRSGVRMPSAAGLVAAFAAIGLLIGGPTVLPDNRQVDRPRPPEVCTGTAPQICLYYEHRRYADLVVPQVQQLMTRAKERGYQTAFVPERLVEQSRTYYPSGPGVQRLWLPAEVYETGELPLELLVESLVSPWHCEQLMNPAKAQLDWQSYHSRFFSLMMTWLDIAEYKPDHPAPVKYELLDPAEARQLIAEFDRCDLDGHS
jgi:hypothetical protein